MGFHWKRKICFSSDFYTLAIALQLGCTHKKRTFTELHELSPHNTTPRRGLVIDPSFMPSLHSFFFFFSCFIVQLPCLTHFSIFFFSYAVPVNGKLRVVRSCGWLNSTHEDDGRSCFQRSGSQDVYLTHCTCFTDGCNGSSSLIPTGGFQLLVSILSVAFLVAKSSL